MSQLTENLSAIASIKSDIAAAIESKGVSMSGVSFGSYADKIGEITTSFVTEPLNVTDNGTYTPGQGVDGYSQVTVNVPQSVTGYTEKELTEGIQIVNLSNSASFVGTYAFIQKYSLKTINLPECKILSHYAFTSCAGLTSVFLPECISLSSNAFQNCDKLPSISLPKCSFIGQGAFQNCASLTEAHVPEARYLAAYAFAATKLSIIDLPKVSNIEVYAFQNCSLLTQVSLPVIRSFTGQNVFRGCSSLNSLTLGTDVYYIANYQNNMFSSTPILSGTGSIYVLSDTYNRWITSTGWSSLSDRFVSVSFSEPILSLSNGVLSGRTKQIYSDFYSYTGISKNDIYGVDLPNCLDVGGYGFYMCSNLVSVNLPLCENIWASGIQSCYKLESVNIPECKYIGSGGFSAAYILSSISLPKCEYLDEWAFLECSSFTSINLPSCSFIGQGCFLLCQSLAQITVGWSGVCQLGGDRVFEAAPITSIYVPSSLVDAYKSAPIWSRYSSRIFPIPE